MNIPGNRRVSLAELATIDADAGVKVWVDGVGSYQAIPRDQKASNAVDGPADALTPISWQPDGGTAVTLLETFAVSGVQAGRGSWLNVSDGIATVHADDMVTEFDFSTPGAHSSLVATTGEVLTFTRASSARFVVDGELVVATSGQARVSDDGLMCEPACTNLSLNFDTLGNGSNGWLLLDSGTMTAGTTDPFGGTDAFTHAYDAGNTGHGAQFYFGNQSNHTFSLWIKPRGTERYLSMGRLPDGAYGAVFDLQKAQVVEPNTGAGTRAACEIFRNGWVRCEVTITATISQGIYWQTSVDGVNWTHAAAPGNGADVYWPQFENNQYATSPVPYNTTRAAEIPLLKISPIADEWSVEVRAKPVGAASWKRIIGTNADGVGNVVISLGTLQAGSTFLLRAANTSGTDGAFYVGSWDTSTVYKSGFAYSHSSTSKHGWHTIVIHSGLDKQSARPAFLVDGSSSWASSGSGAGSGYIEPTTSAGLSLYLGCDSAGGSGGVVIRYVRVRRKAHPARKVLGSSMSLHAGHTRGSFTRAQCIACLGDSNMVPSTTVTTDESFVRIACRANGLFDHDFAVGSKDCNDALSRLQEEVSLGHYTRGVLMIGTNDLNGGAGSAHVIERITRIIAEATALGISLVVCTLPPLSAAGKVLAVNTWIRALTTADVCDINAVLRSAGAGTDETWNAALTVGDGLHANTAGQAVMAAALTTTLAL